MYSMLKQYKSGIFSVILNKLFPEKFLYHNFIVFYYDLQWVLSEAPKTKSSIKIKKVQGSEDELFKQFREKYPAQEFLSRIKKDNETLYTATNKGEIIAYAWVAKKELFLEAINYSYNLNRDEIFLYACFVSREYRGKGIHSLMIDKRLRDYMSDNSYKRAYTGVLSYNKGSIRGVEKAGFKEFKRIKYLKLIGKEKWWGLE